MQDPTKDQVSVIVNKHFGNGHDNTYSVSNISYIESNGYSFIPDMKTYIIEIATAAEGKQIPSLSFLTLSKHPHPPHLPTNSLAIMASLIGLIRTNTPLPLSAPHVDFSPTIIPYEYLISEPAKGVSAAALIPLSDAKTKLGLSEKDASVVDLKIGQLLGQLHKLVQNDWFGRPSVSPPAEPSYSWQETFTSLFEEALDRAQKSLQEGTILPLEEINGYMSRAIAYFLFDDVEAPSLIWFTGSDQDVYLVLKPLSDGTQSLELAAVLPSLGYAIWGDPLLETFFKDIGQDNKKALVEGYIGGGGQALSVFPRHKTKRLWYTLYLALVILGQKGALVDKREWAKGTIDKCVSDLKDAPCY